MSPRASHWLTAGLFTGSMDRKICALNGADGTKLWEHLTGYWVRTTPAVANGVVFVGSDDGSMYALNVADATLVWEYLAGGGIQGAATVVAGLVFFGSSNGKLIAVSTEDGSLIWEYNFGVRKAAFRTGRLQQGSIRNARRRESVGFW